MSAVDPDGLLEFSVVFTDRSLNHMSQRFQQVMRDLSASLKQVYSAHQVAIIPGGGTVAMEAVARQFGRDANVFIIRNGWFSYRWSQIFETSGIARDIHVEMARPTGNGPQPAYAPPAIDDVIAQIRTNRPDIVCAPHVETSAGVILPDDYITALADAAHEVGALFILDCIASGAIWVDMAKTGVDLLISAPQKGWSASPSAGLVMFSSRAAARLEDTDSDSFALDLKKWRAIMAAYENGGHAYHATMPTDALTGLRDTIEETRAFGFDRAQQAQWELGDAVRSLMAEKGLHSVAAPGFGAPGVVVSYTDDPDVKSGQKFASQGMQIAAGVPLAVNEGDSFSTFRVGLFGLDKLKDVQGTVTRLRTAIEQVI
ncbi:aminotransferase class V-fold PLP-dependent enzyme [Paracoccus sp. Z330]|uniref:Aminotransferase class V-fold PLP-dependent enzyme n=1 Tax=Paracoccus onchidii TaxID=3017813 RepID=A0ABT4ZH36_9RHOB|nr:aminotransferase class V-fold PLP-dependent enzyme [Paracoccus onchidii]MDB6178617.1 aminotransferase class V-fold PLP-dependent enzyme [Paracoccus onchidii]